MDASLDPEDPPRGTGVNPMLSPFPQDIDDAMTNHTVSTSFLESIQGIRADLKVMRIDHRLEDQPTREALEAVLTDNAEAIAAHPGRDMLVWSIERTVAELDRTPRETYDEDMALLAAADFHDEDIDAMLAHTMQRHELDEATVRSLIDEINDRWRELADGERE